ncbi:Rrf2 family transcriptional regulator [Fusibacter paucivorans]|uniref:Rrf2 family transcriptional regulator n=1 Tax=Fusibacter paucivorans TaxID=76009 RepID=A0ABS5PL62_9FIRM|nr:Rrf2 family transcriptional regulator [Fusibacter paucivorans]MBS7525316.1 Rrf2 family transcriptional regulator [Fusibacter paucivorans]
MYSSKFTVSIHILSMIALSDGKPITSEYIAGSINTNSALIRRLMSLLKKADLITTQTKVGATGLAKPSEQISLSEVFKAVERETTLFAIHEDTNRDCPVGARIGKVLANVNDQVQSQVDLTLSSIHLSDILEGLK